jgi:cell division protein FtsW (lipid II flippase)
MTKGDRWIWLIVILLSVWSLLAVYSATGTLAYKQGVGTEQYLVKHLVMIVGGLALMYFSHLLDYRYYAGISKILMYITVPLLLYTLFFGTHVNEASRWVTIPIINQTFQTSDMAKLALITFLARTLSKKQENIKDVKTAFFPDHESGMCGVCFNCSGQFINSAYAFWSQHIIAYYRADQYQADCCGISCRPCPPECSHAARSPEGYLLFAYRILSSS